MPEETAPPKDSCLVQKGEQLFVWYDGQTTRMLGLQKIRTLNYEKDEAPMKQLKHSTNFHNLARDVEQEKTRQSNELKSEKSKVVNEAGTQGQVLIEITPECEGAVLRRVKAELFEQKRGAFTELYNTNSLHSLGEQNKDLSGSAFSPVPSRLTNKVNTVFKDGKRIRLTEYDTKDVTNVKLVHGQSDFRFKHEYLKFPNSLSILPLPEVWPKSEVSHLPQLLPPTFTTLGSTAQIWCAKCKLSFRMTSDLVHHMRLRHKEVGVETQSKRRRELQLSCPVCYAYFRERHHLSRHMTSHC